MDIVKSLLNFLKKKDTPEETPIPEGLCSICWGYEEYGGNFHKRVTHQNLDINSTDEHVGWINDYANKHLSGIALRRQGDGDELTCDSCNTTFKQGETHIHTK
jgi:hypothetical protein